MAGIGSESITELGSEFKLRRKWNVDGCLESTIRAHQRNQGEWLDKILEEPLKCSKRVRLSNAWNRLECVLVTVSFSLVLGVFAMIQHLFPESGIGALLRSPATSDCNIVTILTFTAPSDCFFGTNMVIFGATLSFGVVLFHVLRFIWGGWSMSFRLDKPSQRYLDYTSSKRGVVHFVVHIAFKANIATLTIKAWPNMLRPFWWPSDIGIAKFDIDLDQGPKQPAIHKLISYF